MKKDGEVMLYMRERHKGTPQQVAAARAGMSERDFASPPASHFWVRLQAWCCPADARQPSCKHRSGNLRQG